MSRMLCSRMIPSDVPSYVPAQVHVHSATAFFVRKSTNADKERCLHPCNAGTRRPDTSPGPI